MVYKTQNFSVDYLRGVDSDREFISRPTEYVDKTISINLKINVMSEVLAAQSFVFMEELLSYGNIRFNNIFSSNRISDWKRLACETYIYSFYKCLYLGIYSNDVRGKLPDSPAFIGHCLLNHIISEQNFVFKSEDYGIYVNLIFDEGTAQDMLEELEETFPYLKDVKVISPSGDKFIGSSRFDSILDRLRIESKSKDSTNELLTIRSINDSAVVDLVNSMENPLINGFYSSNLKAFFYIPSSKRLHQELSYFVSRANFISVDSINGVASNVNDYYTKVELLDSFHLIAHDVRAITYLIPRINLSKPSFDNYSKDIFQGLVYKKDRMNYPDNEERDGGSEATDPNCSLTFPYSLFI
jgi:hypothetical protein